jgi:hypothetical protein
MAERWRFAPATPDELTRWTGPDAGPPAPAPVTTHPTRDHPAVLSPVAASTLAGQLLGPAAATAAWTLTSPTTATAVIDGRGYVVIDHSDPHGWFTSLGLYEVTLCGGCGGEHLVGIQPGGNGSSARPGPRRRHLELVAPPTRPGRLRRVPATNPTRKETGHPCPAAG